MLRSGGGFSLGVNAFLRVAAGGPWSKSNPASGQRLSLGLHGGAPAGISLFAWSQSGPHVTHSRCLPTALNSPLPHSSAWNPPPITSPLPETKTGPDLMRCATSTLPLLLHPHLNSQQPPRQPCPSPSSQSPTPTHGPSLTPLAGPSPRDSHRVPQFCSQDWPAVPSHPRTLSGSRSPLSLPHCELQAGGVSVTYVALKAEGLGREGMSGHCPQHVHPGGHHSPPDQGASSHRPGMQVRGHMGSGWQSLPLVLGGFMNLCARPAGSTGATTGFVWPLLSLHNALRGKALSRPPMTRRRL